MRAHARAHMHLSVHMSIHICSYRAARMVACFPCACTDLMARGSALAFHWLSIRSDHFLLVIIVVIAVLVVVCCIYVRVYAGRARAEHQHAPLYDTTRIHRIAGVHAHACARVPRLSRLFGRSSSISDDIAAALVAGRGGGKGRYTCE
jgi:hypothetical protein